MGREIRRVPKDWEYPRDESGHYKPMFDQTYLQGIWGHIRYELPWYTNFRHWRHLPEWFDSWPNKAYYRRRWRGGEAAYYQVYENVTEGTPSSPAFASKEDLTKWLIEQGHSEYAAERFVEEGSVPSMLITNGKAVMDIDMYDSLKEGCEAA